MSPLFTIVTVCRNAESSIVQTMDSVLSQSLRDFEYLIIDGASTDRTLSKISTKRTTASIQDISFRILSEPDSGIYNAMNKAIDLAKGEWIIFMNSGDRFFDSHVLEWLKPYCDSMEEDVVYGDTVISSNNLYKYQKVSSNDQPMPFCHQSCATKRTILGKYHFDERYKICADYELYVRIWNAKRRFRYVPRPFAVFLAGGFSGGNYLKLLTERNAINVNHGLSTVQMGEEIIQSYYEQIKPQPISNQSKWNFKLLVKCLIPKFVLRCRLRRIVRYKMLKDDWTKDLSATLQGQRIANGNI